MPQTGQLLVVGGGGPSIPSINSFSGSGNWLFSLHLGHSTVFPAWLARYSMIWPQLAQEHLK